MRLKLGRPDIREYRDRFAVPSANGAFSVTFFGVSSLLFHDGRTGVMTDGFFSRPSLTRVALGTIAPNNARISAGLRRMGLDRPDSLDVVLALHTHFDHALDSVAVAQRTGAAFLGGRSASMIGRGHGLRADKMQPVSDGMSLTSGAFTLTFLESAHCEPDRARGQILEPVPRHARWRSYRCGESWSVLLAHASGRTALIQGSAGFATDKDEMPRHALHGRRADVAFLGVGQLGLQSEEYIRTYWTETVEAVGASRVVLLHWDDFLRTIDLDAARETGPGSLRSLPYAVDDLHQTMRIFDELASGRVSVQFPTPWRREDPWR